MRMHMDIPTAFCFTARCSSCHRAVPSLLPTNPGLMRIGQDNTKAVEEEPRRPQAKATPQGIPRLPSQQLPCMCTSALFPLVLDLTFAVASVGTAAVGVKCHASTLVVSGSCGCLHTTCQAKRMHGHAHRLLFYCLLACLCCAF